jgi:hypothetical protein
LNFIFSETGLVCDEQNPEICVEFDRSFLFQTLTKTNHLMKKLAIFLFVAFCAIKPALSQSVTGTWVFNGSGLNITMILNSDGTGEFQGMPIKYKAQNGLLSIDDGVQPVIYNYRLNQNTLVVSGGGMQMTVTFTRPGNSQESAVNQQTVNQQPVNQSSAQNQMNNRSSFAQNTQAGTGNSAIGMTGQPASQSGNGGSNLSGVWEGQTGKLVFYPDGSMLYNNASYQYSVSGNQMNIGGSDGSISFSYALSGNSLTLSQNANSAQYSKTSSLRPETVDQQIVGKWCIMASNYNNYSGGGSSSEECITLNADGTYVYSYSAERSGYASNQSEYGGTANQSGDRGTWKSDGVTISSVSQTTGKASRYTLTRENSQNGDPMIVIGGKKFVTAYNRPRW